MKYSYLLAGLLFFISGSGTACAGTGIALKSPGRNSVAYSLCFGTDGKGSATDNTPLPVEIYRTETADGTTTDISYVIKALETCRFNLSDTIASGMLTDDCDFYMPGFWYHRNLRSPLGAPSFSESESWSVREDRLSSPLTGIYDMASGKGITVMRLNPGENSTDCVPQNLSGEVILPGKTSVGSTGFCNDGSRAALVFGFPYAETPKRYIRKLTLIDPVTAFMTLEKGDSVAVKWRIRRFDSPDYSGFVADVWDYTFDTFSPLPVSGVIDNEEAKRCMASYFDDSYVDRYDLKYFSGHGMRTDDCSPSDGFQIGFVGRVLLNAFNAKEYAESRGDSKLEKKADAVFASVFDHGFTDDGYLIEDARLEKNDTDGILSIRRQSEGVYALLTWLDYEHTKGRSHPMWEKKVAGVLDNLLVIQSPDGSFPRKFRGNGQVIDPSGGSTPSATLPLAMAYSYFGNPAYLESARRTGEYLEKEIIDKADYFSSTLDANCEDKEASLYASTAMFFLTKVTEGDEARHYLDLCRKSAYFCLSWYYMWDVPFAPGQMLGDVGFKSRGWGNVSVENNHIDVFVFDFATILDHLSAAFSEPRFSRFSEVIRSSMLQLMPTSDDMFCIARTGYYPEVVQHTTWDYGRNGKGFYNDIFAPGWTVASLWQMLSPERIDSFFAGKKRAAV